MPEKNKPLSKEDIGRNPDPKIDEDFKGYPHGTANDDSIQPRTGQDHKTAGTKEKDGEKMIIPPGARKGLDEQDSDGSANAFDDK